MRRQWLDHLVCYLLDSFHEHNAFKSESTCQCCSLGGRLPERVRIDGSKIFTPLMQHVLRLCGIAEGQQGQHVQPDARLAVAHCLHAVRTRVRSGLPFVPEPPVCLKLAEVAGRAMASFAAAPLAASAASVLLPSIGDFLLAVSGSTPEGAKKLVGTRRSLLASIELLLEGPSALLSAASVAARGPFVVIEAIDSALGAIRIANWSRGAASSQRESRMAGKVLLQLEALLADPMIATQLKEWSRYPLCSATTSMTRTAEATDVVTQIDLLEIAFLEYLFAEINPLITSKLSLQTLPKVLADCKQQLLAVSAAVARAALLPDTPVLPAKAGQLPASAPYLGYLGVHTLADMAGVSAQALYHDPSSICQPTGLAAIVASGAVSALAFLAVHSDSSRRPPETAAGLRGCMDYAAQSAKYLHQLAQQLLMSSSVNAEAARSALTTWGAAQSLVRLLRWLSEPTTATATASGVFQEALPALRLMAAIGETRQMLAVAGGAHEWEPVASALRRRMPRHMAARFLPEMDRVTATVVGRTGNATGDVNVDAAAVAAAEAAMAELLQVRGIFHF